jgi:bifunctional non-homologous end joining protein LigD
MALEKYKKKRDFKETTEPKGGKSIDKNLIFVVQKHSASHLHYDFRLELKGVLVSWAVPKGPSMNSEDKRLAMMVEDHPFDYRDFEGIIPKGNYGAGEVIVWDTGIYIPEGGTTSKKENEKIMYKMLSDGDVKIVLLGKKLKGEFAIVKMKGAKENNSWLLIKKNDEYASDADILKKDKSVKSNLTIEKLKNKNADREKKKRTQRKLF